MAMPAVERYAEKLSSETLLEMFWFMLLSRRVDERAWVLHRQGKIAFHVSAIGHEALQIAAAFAINRQIDYVFPYYRDLPLTLALGLTPANFMLSLFGKQGEITSGARQMPSHFSAREFNIVSGSSVVATQVPQAAGAAFAIKYRLANGLQDSDDETQPRLALTCLGEGSTSQGEWHEGMNWVGVHELPMICLVQNNQYAISMRQDQQMAVSNVADRASAYGVKGIVADGFDVFDSYNAMKTAVEVAYAGEGATLVEAKTYRLTPHSSDDDDRSYRTREEVEEYRKKDPLVNFQAQLMESGILTDQILDDYEEKAKDMVDDAHRTAENADFPPAEAAIGDVYAPLEAV